MSDDSFLFTYLAPFLGVLLVAIGIGAAVPGGYALVQEQIGGCGEPTIAVESPGATTARFGNGSTSIAQFDYEDLAPAEQAAFVEALDDPVNEAHVDGPFPNGPAFRNGSLVTYQGDRYYTTVVSENPCFQAAPLQFPLGVFAIGLGVVMILMPPAYRVLVRLEEESA